MEQVPKPQPFRGQVVARQSWFWVLSKVSEPVKEHLQQIPQSSSLDEQEDHWPEVQVLVPTHSPEPQDSVKNSSMFPSQSSSLLLQISVVDSIDPVQEPHCPLEHV